MIVSALTLVETLRLVVLWVASDGDTYRDFARIEVRLLRLSVVVAQEEERRKTGDVLWRHGYGEDDEEDGDEVDSAEGGTVESGRHRCPHLVGKQYHICTTAWMLFSDSVIVIVEKLLPFKSLYLLVNASFGRRHVFFVGLLLARRSGQLPVAARRRRRDVFESLRLQANKDSWKVTTFPPYLDT